uniref:Piwi domain-containing protein n=1 Tax=Caenorhabditis tropicalis TaxID=1561998 RepID=A0A1I7UMV1_9PELO
MEELAKQLNNVKFEKNIVCGSNPLAAKIVEKNKSRGTPVSISTNLRRIDIEKNQPIYKYAVQVLFFYNKGDKEESVEISKSVSKGPEHERDKAKCSKVYKKSVSQSPELQKGGPFFYDRQSCLYSFSRLKNDEIMCSLKGAEISSRPSFIRAEFKLSKVKESFQSTSNDISKTVNIRPAQADKTILEALNLIISGKPLEDPNVLTIGNCVHYLYDDSKIQMDRVNGSGGKSSAVGTSKSIRTLEGKEKTPTLYMTTELKTTLFHPDNATLFQVLSDYSGFSPQMKCNNPWALSMKDFFLGVSCYVNYGKFKDLGDERVMIKIKGFGLSAREQTFECDKKETTVFKYFKEKYNMSLQYPDLFTVLARGRDDKNQNIPVECLVLCNSQPVRTEQMSKDEQAKLIRLAAAKPHERKRNTDKVVTEVGLGANVQGLIRVSQPETVTGYVLPKPTIKFGGEKKVNWNDPNKRGPATDFNITRFSKPAKLLSWEIVFDQNVPLDSAIGPLINTMKEMGMEVRDPQKTFIVGGKLRPIFENAVKNKRQMLLFITKSSNNYHQEMKCLEQEFDLITQDIRFETALRLPQQQNTRKNIINKINIKLGGLNYEIDNEDLKNRLVIGFETSQKGGLGDAPIAIGFSANMSAHHMQFTGGYIFVKRTSDVYGSIVQTVVKICMDEVIKNRGKPSSILVYFSGVTEGQYGLINEVYVQQIKEACLSIHANCKPHIHVIAASKIHNTRLYKEDQRGFSNLEPGTVVDETIVNPLLNEWYTTSAVARQGTNKAVKYTLIFTTQPVPISVWERLTNDLAYDHQIVYHPVSLPAPLYIAGSYSTRGAQVLAQRRAIYNAEGEFDFEATNEKFGVLNKKLFSTRFNA